MMKKVDPNTNASPESRPDGLNADKVGGVLKLNLSVESLSKRESESKNPSESQESHTGKQPLPKNA